jgi:murein DD-endopeptidase MepM/ murein hydrolase activator NlpD
MHKLIAAALLIAAVVFPAAVFPTPAAADSPTVLPPAVPLLATGAFPTIDSWSQGLAAVVAAEAAYLPEPGPYMVTAFDTFSSGSAADAEEWALAVIVPAAVVQGGWEELDLDQLADVLLVRDPTGAVRGHVRTHPAFWELARRVPKQLVDYGPSLDAAALGPSAQQEELNYRFPWTAGQTWWLGSGWHTGYGQDALDFSPLTDADPSTNSAVLAAAGGTLRMACQADGEQRLLWIDHPNGERTGYLHLDRASVATAVESQGLIGQVVPQGTYLGVVYRGDAKTDGQCPANFPNCTFNTLCGYGNAAHVHFLAPNRSIKLDGFNIGDIGAGALGNRFISSNTRAGSMADTQAPAAWLMAPVTDSVTISPHEDQLRVTVTAIDPPPAAPAAGQAAGATPGASSGVASVRVQLAYQDRSGAWHASPWENAAPATADMYTATVATCGPGLRVPHNSPVRLNLRATDKAGNEAEIEAAGLFRFNLPDVDGDCTVGLRDLADVGAALGGHIPAQNATGLDYDIDGDGQLSTGDAATLMKHLLEAGPPGGVAFRMPAPPADPLLGSKRVTFVPLVGPAGGRVAQGVAVSGTTAYVADWQSGGLTVVDTPTALTSTLSSRLELGARAFSLATGRDAMYLTDPQDAVGRIWLLSTAQPLTPTVVATLTVPGEPLQVIGASSPISDLIYIAAGTSGLHIVDVTKPQTPTILASLDTPGSATGLAFVATPGGERIVLIADRDSGLIVADVENASQPRVLAALDTPGVALGVTAAISGSEATAFVADGLGGLQVVDITTPASPQNVGSYPTMSAANGAAIDGSMLYAAVGWRGVLALDVANPRAPRFAGAYDTPGYANYVLAAGERLYAADGDAGLQILQVTIAEGTAYRIFAPLAGKEITP